MEEWVIDYDLIACYNEKEFSVNLYNSGILIDSIIITGSDGLMEVKKTLMNRWDLKIVDSRIVKDIGKIRDKKINDILNE